VPLKPVDIATGGLKHLKAKVIQVAKNCACELCKRGLRKVRKQRGRWHLILEPANSDYANFHVWINADSAYEADRASYGKDTGLGDFVSALLELGFDAASVDELFQQIVGKVFLWRRHKPRRARRETWLPTGLVEGEEDATRACKGYLANNLEPGKAYTFDEVRAFLRGKGFTYDDGVIRGALNALVEEEKAFEIPTKPPRFFYQG